MSNKSKPELPYFYPKFTLVFVLLLIVVVTAGCAPVEVIQDLNQLGVEAASSDLSDEQVEEMTDEQIPMQAEGMGGVTIIDGDEAALREFIQRYFIPLYPGVAEDQMTIIYIGRIPENIPFEFLLPEGAVTVATIQEPWAWNQYQVILDVPQSAEVFGESYSQALMAAGWRPAPEHAQAGGFVTAEGFGEQYCLGEDEGYLQVLSREVAQKTTDVRIHLQVPQDPSLCQEKSAEYMDRVMSQIPTLKAPSGVRMTGGGSGSSSDGSAYTSTDLMTELSARDLLAHYNTQLEQAGWKMFEQGDTEVVSWSAWSFTDEKAGKWGGTLVVMDSYLDSERRFALLSVEEVP